MGVNTSTKTKKGNIIHFESQPFSQGKFRYCFRGTITGPYQGNLAVVKAFKQKPLRTNFINAQLQLKVYGIANDYARMFNQVLESHGIHKKIYFPEPELIQVKQLSFQSLIQERPYFHVGDYICAERFLPGIYKKWTNNAGFSTKNEMMQAFQHYTFIKSGKFGICCDMQGVQIKNGYLLTDPAINSVNQSFGNTDIGAKGIEQIMGRHQCNKICKRIGLESNSKYNFSLRPVWNSTSQRRSHIFGI